MLKVLCGAENHVFVAADGIAPFLHWSIFKTALYSEKGDVIFRGWLVQQMCVGHCSLGICVYNMLNQSKNDSCDMWLKLLWPTKLVLYS